jgi:hypothetical protein
MICLFCGQLFRSLFLTVFVVTQLFILTSCSTPLRIQSDFVPVGSLRVAQVMAIAKRTEIVQMKEVYNAIIASGVNDSEIVDGSVVVARVYCCGGISEDFSSEVVNARMLFIPRGLNVARGDMVEVRTGRPPKNEDAGLLNTVTRVVEKYEENKNIWNCWWDPKNDRLWLRVLYCNWMLKEGWVKQGGTYPAWFKAPAPDLPGK